MELLVPSSETDCDRGGRGCPREYPTASKTLSFFSGGVDAFFTALYHSETPDPHHQIPIDDLVNVWGFDIPISNTEAFRKIEEPFREAAALPGKEFVSVATNLRTTQLKHCDREYIIMVPHSPAWPMPWKRDTAGPSSPPAAATTKPSRTVITRR